MKTNGKLFALVAVGMALAMVTATGAFSTVTAERNVDVVTESDANAYVGMTAHTGPNGGYASTTTGGELTVDMESINPDSETHVNNVFNITNQGEENVTVWIEDNENNVTFHTHDSDVGTMESAGKVVLEPGETVQVSLHIDARGEPAGVQLLDQVTVHAERTEAASTISVHASVGITA